MLVSKKVVTRMARLHPHSANLLKAFVPLLEAQEALGGKLAVPALPPLDQAAFVQGESWLSVRGGKTSIYLDDAFVAAAPKVLGAAALKGFADREDELSALRALLVEKPDLCRELATLGFEGRQKKVEAWAREYEQDPDITLLFSMHLAAAAAVRVERASRARMLPTWSKEYCPLCGSRPHGSALRGKEGRRFLQCSLCRKEWAFSRTSCPACAQDDPRELNIFFHENSKYERAEVCNKCNHYILGVDMRELADDTPLELYLLCMAPLDFLMQEKGFVPVNAPE